MRAIRCYTDQSLAIGQSITLEVQASRHLAQILRLRVGAEVLLFNGDGKDYASELIEVNKIRVTAQVKEVRAAAAEAKRKVLLAQALAKGERMDFVIQKATELGVSEILPLITNRVEVKLKGERLEKRMQHWRGVAIAASEQSGRAVLPTIHAPLSLSDWCTQNTEARRFVLHPGAQQSLSELAVGVSALQIAIGPEGGFDDDEVKLMIDAGFQMVHLGERVLRTETAALAALAVLNCHDL